MVTLRVEGMGRLQRLLERRLGPRAMQEAMAKGINKTADTANAELTQGLNRHLDRPTPFTMKAIKTSKARPKPEPSAIVYVQPLQARYLKWPIYGGTLPTVIEPAAGRLNKYGNIIGKNRAPRGLKGIKGNNPKRFIAEIKGGFGVWERYGPKGRKVKPIVLVSRSSPRSKIYDFEYIGKKSVKRVLQSDVRAALIDALRA